MAEQHGEEASERVGQVESAEMKLCMFHPNDTPMERGWVGKIDGERVIHLAAQTLQSFFLGGGGAREHAEYALDDVTLLVPVLYPPAVRVFNGPREFVFANPTSVAGPAATIVPPAGADSIVLLTRLAAVIGAEGAIGGFSIYADWMAPGLPSPKDSDFGSQLGPCVVTRDEIRPEHLDLFIRQHGTELDRGSLGGFDWDDAVAYAAAGTELRPGDVIAGPWSHDALFVEGSGIEIDVAGVGVLSATVERS